MRHHEGRSLAESTGGVVDRRCVAGREPDPARADVRGPGRRSRPMGVSGGRCCLACVPCAGDHFDEGVAHAPVEVTSGQGSGGHDAGWIPGSAWRELGCEVDPCDPGHGGHDLAHRNPVAAAKVVHRFEVAPGGQGLGCGHVGGCQVGHVHVVTHARAVFGRVVDAVDAWGAALTEGRTPRINGIDYPTEDGTCVRDYVHVADLATSHVAAAQALATGRDLEPVYNLGSGDGVSVSQIMTAMAGVTGIDFTPELAPRRPGDPARIVASGALAARDLDWRMRHTLIEMVTSAWNARQAATTS